MGQLGREKVFFAISSYRMPNKSFEMFVCGGRLTSFSELGVSTVSKDLRAQYFIQWHCIWEFKNTIIFFLSSLRKNLTQKR